jgi:16S rRNA (cytosine967-C5)-methyltransferase
LDRDTATKRSDARSIATRVLQRVWEDAAYASATLDAELRRLPGLDPRDAGLATELVYGVLRTQGFLEAELERGSDRPRNKPLPSVARAHLLIGAYSLAFLDRVPGFAAVSEAVTGVREATDARVGGYANAVLRRMGERMERGRPELTEAISASAPGWLRGALRRSLGRAEAVAYLAAGPVPPPAGLCAAKPEDREALASKVRASLPQAHLELGTVSPRAILVRGAGDPRRLEGAESAFVVQEEGSQVVALALGARPGERVLDACSGRGNKAFTLAQDVGPEGAVDAADLHPHKLEASGARGFVRHTYAVDWTVGPGEVPEGYDRVLVDAPCSGTGTLRRRPELGARREEQDLSELQALQVDILRRASTRVRPGGRVVYAVCSVLREEAEEVVTRVLEPWPEGPSLLEAQPFDEPHVDALARGGASLRLLPHVHGTDGYFLASFRRLSDP